jgi:hypothetical protein
LNLDKSFAELARTVKLDGSAIFIEPLGHNPIINFYRRLTPGMRTEDEHPLMAQDIQLARKYFCKVETKYFHLLALGAVPFRETKLFNSAMRSLSRLDSMMFGTMPWLGRYAWMVVMIMSEPKGKF